MGKDDWHPSIPEDDTISDLITYQNAAKQNFIRVSKDPTSGVYPLVFIRQVIHNCNTDKFGLLFADKSKFKSLLAIPIKTFIHNVIMTGDFIGTCDHYTCQCLWPTLLYQLVQDKIIKKLIKFQAHFRKYTCMKRCRSSAVSEITTYATENFAREKRALFYQFKTVYQLTNHPKYFNDISNAMTVSQLRELQLLNNRVEKFNKIEFKHFSCRHIKLWKNYINESVIHPLIRLQANIRKRLVIQNGGMGLDVYQASNLEPTSIFKNEIT